MSNASVRLVLGAIVIFTGVLLCRSSRAAFPLRRWAIVAESEVRQSGLADLLTVRLSKLDNLELVEREQIDLALRELEVASYSSAEAGKERIRLGQILQADALLLLHYDRSGPQPSLEIVVAETSQGLRLARQRTTHDVVKVKRQSDACANLVERTRRRFHRGVERVYGVPQFLCENLVHDYDHLQQGYAVLLSDALTRAPGVAVIAIEEAAAIAEELRLTGAELGERRMPIFIEIDYRVAKPRSEAEGHVRFGVRLRRGTGSREQFDHETPIDDAAAWLTASFPTQLVGLVDDAQEESLTPAQQFTALRDRADQFAEIGAFGRSSALREAALLLKPNDADVRLALISDYLRLVKRRFWEFDLEDRRPENPQFVRAVEQRVDAYCAALRHLTFLVRNRLIGAIQVVELADQWTGRALPFGSVPRSLRQKKYRRAEEAEAEFMLSVYPRVLDWSGPDSPNRHWPHHVANRWQGPLVKAFLHRADRIYRTKEELNTLRRVLTKVVPDNLDTSFLGIRYFVDGPGFRYHLSSEQRKQFGPEAITKDDWLTFLEALAESDHQVVSVHAAYGLIYQRFFARAASQHSEDELREMLKETEALLNEFAAIEYEPPWHFSRRREPIYSALKDLHGNISRTLSPPKRPRMPPSSTTPEERVEPEYAVRYRRIDLRFKRHDGRTAPLDAKSRWRRNGRLKMLRMADGGESFDILWHSGVVLLMREKGVIEELLVDPEPYFADVAWDGELIWVATHGEGVWVLDPSGKILAKIDSSHGLPPVNRAIMVEPVRPGVVCAVGSFGEHRRAWCAILRRESGTQRVRVIHEARSVPTDYSAKHWAEDPQCVFQPGWMHTFRAADGSRKLLVGRAETAIFAEQRPLMIDLKTQQVDIYPHHLNEADRSSSRAYFSRDGELFEARDFPILHYARLGDKWPSGKTYRKLAKSDRGYFAKVLLPYGGYLYAAGREWARFKPGDASAEILPTEPLLIDGRPSRHTRFAVSSHYGPVALLDGQLYDVVLDQPEKRAETD